MCGGHLIDTIINFGDNLEEDIMERAEKQAQKADLIISLGSTMAVSSPDIQHPYQVLCKIYAYWII